MGEAKPDLALVLQHYGAVFHIKPYRWGMIRCVNPAHRDKEASLGVNLKLGETHCHSCPLRGDSWAIIMQLEGLDFRGAKRWAEEQLGFAGGRVEREPAQPYRPSWG